MIFVGDIAIPYVDALKLKQIPHNLKKKNWFGNLEGGICNLNNINITGVYNDENAVSKLVDDFNFIGFGLANNHIFDSNSINETKSFLKSKNLLFTGIGENFKDASKPILFNESNNDVLIVNFGWEVIQCPVNKTGPTVSPLKKNFVINRVKCLLSEYPNHKLVVFMHWNYELESEPQPFERELAKNLIDIGASGIIGCHPHRIGGFERYKDKPIVYSLGNWLFKQDYYLDGKVKFPDFCNKQLAFEWDFSTNDFRFHIFEYSKKESSVTYFNTLNESEMISNYTPFNQLSRKDYNSWYRKNHYHKFKGLPIYYWNDKSITIYVKNTLNKCRDFLIKKLN